MVVTVADREADIYDLYHEAQHQHSSKDEASAYWLVRAFSNRKILNSNGESEDKKLIEQTKSSKPVCTITFETPSKEKQIGRQVTQNLHVKELTLSPPDRKRKISKKYRDKRVKVTVIIAAEVSPPEGQEPLEWILLTNRALA